MLEPLTAWTRAEGRNYTDWLIPNQGNFPLLQNQSMLVKGDLETESIKWQEKFRSGEEMLQSDSPVLPRLRASTSFGRMGQTAMRCLAPPQYNHTPAWMRRKRSYMEGEHALVAWAPLHAMNLTRRSPPVCSVGL